MMNKKLLIILLIALFPINLFAQRLLNPVRVLTTTGVEYFYMDSIFLADYSGNRGYFRIRSVAGTGANRWNFHIPSNFHEAEYIRAVVILDSSGAIGSGKDIDIYSEYGGIGEAYDVNSEADTTSTYDFSSYSLFDIAYIDLLPILTNIEANDKVGIYIDHKGIGGSIEYIAIEMRYK